MSLIISELKDMVGTIIINNPKKRNALSKVLVNEMIDSFDALIQSKARVIILRAQKGASVWSAGHDIRELPLPGRDPLAYSDPLLVALRSVQALPVPVIAMIEGGVWGGACDLALSCDILIGSPTASFTMTPAKVGIPYNASGILHFINTLGVNTVKEMFFTARSISAAHAERCGILNHLVPTEEIETFTWDLAISVAENSPLSIRAIKEQIRLLAGAHPLNPQTFEKIQGLRRMVYDSQDYAEGIRAFQEKRKPAFSGE